MTFMVPRQVFPPAGDADWDKVPWRDIPSEMIQNYMGRKPNHFPRTEVKLAYDDVAIYVMFRVEDRYVRAVTADHQDSVYKDSCVEFFFTPGPDVSKGYFNLEMNCGGTMLFHFQPEPRKGRIVIPNNECDKIRRAHSLPRIVEPEIKDSVTWTVEYWLPIALLRIYCRVTTPKPHAIWRANFYKCADNSTHPHWLTWSPIDFPSPDFHLPQFFGSLEFE